MFPYQPNPYFHASSHVYTRGSHVLSSPWTRMPPFLTCFRLVHFFYPQDVTFLDTSPTWIHMPRLPCEPKSLNGLSPGARQAQLFPQGGKTSSLQHSSFLPMRITNRTHSILPTGSHTLTKPEKLRLRSCDPRSFSPFLQPRGKEVSEGSLGVHPAKEEDHQSPSIPANFGSTCLRSLGLWVPCGQHRRVLSEDQHLDPITAGLTFFLLRSWWWPSRWPIWQWRSSSSSLELSFFLALDIRVWSFVGARIRFEWLSSPSLYAQWESLRQSRERERESASGVLGREIFSY